MQVGSDFTPAFQAVLEKVEEDAIRLWPLLDLPALPTWVNGKMALLGYGEPHHLRINSF